MFLAAGIKNGMTILDIGSGTGNVSSKLRRLTESHIICTDYSLDMLAKARGKQLPAVCADADKQFLPFKSASIDVVVGAYFIHQINNIQHLFEECYRILASGAILILTSSHYQIDHFHPVPKKFFPSCASIEKSRFPDIVPITKALGSAGFNDIKSDDVLIEKNEINREYLEKIKNRYVSTYYLMTESEFMNGVRMIEDSLANNNEIEIIEWRGTLISAKKLRRPCQ